MKQLKPFLLLCFAAFALSASGQTDPNWGNNIPCSGGGSPQCCQNPGACNGPGGADGWSFDPDNMFSGGCYYNCIEWETGCTDETACNYDPAAIGESGSCTYADEGYDCVGNCLADADGDGICDPFEVAGCQDSIACNYDAAATNEDGSCDYCFCLEGTEWSDSLQGCMSNVPPQIDNCGPGTYWNQLEAQCLPFDSCPEDLNEDGIIGSSDLLMLLGAYAQFCPEETELESCFKGSICNFDGGGGFPSATHYSEAGCGTLFAQTGSGGSNSLVQNVYVTNEGYQEGDVLHLLHASTSPGTNGTCAIFWKEGMSSPITTLGCGPNLYKKYGRLIFNGGDWEVLD